MTVEENGNFGDNGGSIDTQRSENSQGDQATFRATLPGSNEQEETPSKLLSRIQDTKSLSQRVNYMNVAIETIQSNIDSDSGEGAIDEKE